MVVEQIKEEFYPVALTIAGSDSGGGAGIQADLRTFSAFGVYGCSAITAVTAQNPLEVRRVDPLQTEAVKEQIDAVAEGFSLKSVKTGMLHDASIIATVARFLKTLNIPVIVDPVMVSSSGHKLLEPDAVGVLKNELIPVATWITPNIPEAELLTGKKIDSPDGLTDAAIWCEKQWNCHCILKGGHLAPEHGRINDVVSYRRRIYKLSSPFVEDVSSSHGTGCTFSAALAASFALGMPWKEALVVAKGFVYGSLKEAVSPGEGLDALYPPADNYIREIKLK